MKFGARMIKTGLAITLAIYIAIFFDFQTPAFAGIAAVFAVQPSIYRSYQSIIEQIQSNIIGALVAVVFVLTFGSSPVFIGLAAIVVISLNLRLNMQGTIPLALVTVIALMESPGDHFISFAATRFSGIMVGVFASFLINLIFLPPKHETKLYYKNFDLTMEIIQWTRMITSHMTDHSVLKAELDQLKEKLIKTNSLFLLYKEDRSYTKKKQYAKSRKLVLFRQMLVATTTALDALKKLYRIENEFGDLPESFKSQFIDVFHQASTYHEQILFKYSGKLKEGISVDTLLEITTKREALKQLFMTTYAQSVHDTTMDAATLLLSITLDYTDQLEHLDKLLESFHTYHKDENAVKITDKES